MSTIKCPLCEAENPEETEICRVCGAHLKPDSNILSIPPDDADDLLASLRQAGAVEPDVSLFADEAGSELEDTLEPEEIPEWLQRIRQMSDDTEETTGESDWLGAEEQEAPDWIRALAPKENEEQAETEIPGVQPGDEGQILESTVQPGEDEETQPDWLKELENWKPSGETEPVDFHVEPELPLEETGDEEAKPGEELPDWLRMPEPEAAPDAAAEGEELPSLEVVGGEAFIPSELQAEDEDLDAWLSQLGASSEEDAGGLSALSSWDLVSDETIETPQESSDAIELAAGSETPVDEGEAAPGEQPQTDDMPEWMRLREEPATQKPESPEENLPDWLLQSEGLAGEEEEIEQADEALAQMPPETTQREESLPDWLAVGATAKAGDVEELQQGWDLPADEGDVKMPLDAGDLSDWLGDLDLADSSTVFETQEPGEMAGTEKPVNIPPFVGDNLAEWMQDEQGEDLTPQPEREDVAEQPEMLQKADLPDWLDESVEETAVSEELAAAEPPAGEIKEGELPDWLSAMRPIETVLPQAGEVVDDKKVEQAGPLAGLRAVLPGQPAAAHYRKPPIYSLKLQVSEKQRAHAAMLENLLEEEKRYSTVKPSRMRASQRALRMLIGVLLIVIILLPLLGFPQAGIKVGQIANVGAFYREIEAVPAGASVLLAVDYAPGYSGEMRFAAKGVIQSLMLHELRLATVSTQPTGAVLAEGLKQLALEEFPEYEERYNERDWFINLGYLPGEMISLQELAHKPQQAVQYGMSAGLENRAVWDSAVLQNINRLDDFSMVILITDTFESGRAWIEQVQPSLEDVPFLVISSAQAAPMLQPYVQSGQVQGLLAGMAGGLSFEQLTLIPGLERGAFWLSNQFGLAAAILIIVLGALFEGISSLAGRNRSDQEA